MRRLAAAVVMILPCVTLWLVGPPMIGQGLLALGYPSAAAAFFDDPDQKGVAFYFARRWRESADAFGIDATNAYNRGNALARAERFAEAVAAYDQALAADAGDEDAAFNKALVASLIAEKPASADANAINANSAASRTRDTHDEFMRMVKRAGRATVSRAAGKEPRNRARREAARPENPARPSRRRSNWAKDKRRVRRTISMAPAARAARKSTSPRRSATAIGAFGAGWRRARFSRRSNGCRRCQTIRADF